jgi:hypothetical protein
MAAALAKAIDAAPDAVVVALMGNLHARSDSPRWLGWHLRRRWPDLVTLEATFSGGTAWILAAGADEPAAKGVRGSARGANPHVTLFSTRDDRGYDGELYVGAVSASPPT